MLYFLLNFHFKMEPQRKRMYPMTEKKISLDDTYQNKSSTSDYMNKVGEDLEAILASSFEHTGMTQEESIKNSLEQLEHHVTDIKCTLEKKKPKVSLIQINEKLDFIIEILRSSNT